MAELVTKAEVVSEVILLYLHVAYFMFVVNIIITVVVLGQTYMQNFWQFTLLFWKKNDTLKYFYIFMQNVNRRTIVLFRVNTQLCRARTRESAGK